jgi:flagellar export protein FliJ
MKKFVFSLEKVLDFKQQTLDVMKNELSILQIKLKELEKEIAELNEKFAATNRKMVDEMQTGLSAGDIAVYKLYFDTLNQKIRRLLGDRQKLSDVIADKKAGIVQINSEISGLEKLKDKQLDEYLKTVRKHEELAIEEFVSQSRSAAV